MKLAFGRDVSIVSDERLLSARNRKREAEHGGEDDESQKATRSRLAVSADGKRWH